MIQTTCTGTLILRADIDWLGTKKLGAEKKNGVTDDQKRGD